MVESEAKELNEDVMLGAVMFGHRHFQPVIQAIIELAEKAAKEPRDHNVADDCRWKRKSSGWSSRSCVRPTPFPQDGAPERRRRRQGQGDGALLPGRRGQSDLQQAAHRRRVQGRRSQDRALEHPRHRQAHRRPRPEDRASDRGRGRRAAARPRLGAVHPRRDPGAGGRHARHRRGRAVDRRAAGDLQGDLPAALQLPALLGRRDRPHGRHRAGARSATASSPGARSIRCCRRRTISPTPSAWCRRSPSRTARRRWRPSAAPRSR